MIKTFKEACEKMGINPNEERFIKGSKDTIAYEKLKIIRNAINNGQAENWLYYPYFDKSKKPGFGFDASSYYCWDTGSSGSSRLGYNSKEKALWAAKHFEDIYYDYMVEE